MGVPAFFMWLSRSCPKVVIPARPRGSANGSLAWAEEDDVGMPKIDCLYLDMNALIHPCSHPTSDTNIPPPTCEEDMWKNLEEYINSLMDIINPQKVLYMAIDGVAPRAKMNQQRGRRFRSAMEIYSGKARKRKLAELWEQEGFQVPSQLVEATSWDHNVITPGTKFMKSCSAFLRKYIAESLLYNPRWANLKVIFSDANTPGEGEHKILDYIRRQRAQPGYDPNTSHCIYGADADLIMLSLSTHEPHFYIIREALIDKLKLKGLDDKKRSNDAKRGKPEPRAVLQSGKRFTVDFSLINMYYVREFIENYFQGIRREMDFPWDLENLIDDFVLLCFFGGNDFLPHLPALSIHQGGVDILMHLYKRMLPDLGGYITKNGRVDLEKIEVFMKEFAKSEEGILRQIEQNQKELVSCVVI
jgi:5'-3' exoribonuclease 2